MTKKHYEAIAAIIKHHRDNLDISDMAAYEIASGLAYEFERDNPKFNRAMFLIACGIKTATAQPYKQTACIHGKAGCIYCN